MRRRNEKPLRRVNPGGSVRWVARYTDRDSKRRIAGTFELKGPCKSPAEDGSCCAQHAIYAAYEREQRTPAKGVQTVGGYVEGDGHRRRKWLDRHPRADRTNTSYEQRVRAVLDVRLEDVRLRDWPMCDLERRHATDLVDVLLTDQGRSAKGAVGILRVLSAMFEDAIDDGVCDNNPFMRVRVRANDPRIRKQPKRIRTFSWGQMHAFAAAAARVRTGKDEPSPMDRWRAVYAEPMVRVFADCGPRLGEVLPLERSDLRPAGECPYTLLGERCRVEVPHLHLTRTAHKGRVSHGTKIDHGEAEAGRAVPVPAELYGMLAGLPPRLDTRLLFPTPEGLLWREQNFFDNIWTPTVELTGMSCTRHEFRHSWISLLRAGGIDPADLAQMAGHSVETATKRYTHALGRSFAAVAEAVGS